MIYQLSSSSVIIATSKREFAIVMTRVKWYILTPRDDGVSINLIFDSWVIAMQITNRLTQSGYHYGNRDYGVSCSSRLHVVRTIVSAPVISVRIQLEAFLARITRRGKNRPEKAQAEGLGRSTPSRCLPSSRLRIARVSVFRVEADVRGLVLARQNLTKQFAPKQTTASGLLVNKQHIYF